MPFPSKDQELVINSDARRLVVVAAPGTGKTTTIVERMIRLLIDDPRREVSFITFTRTSRRDTELKLIRTVGEKELETAEGTFPHVSTLHAFAKALVHRYAGMVGRGGDFSVWVPKSAEPEIIISEVIDDLRLAITPKGLKDQIAQFRSTGEWRPNVSLTEEQRAAILIAFERSLQFYDTFDHEGLIWAACDILRKGPSDLPGVLLQVDEYQDLNPKDQELVSLAGATESSRVVVVGDDAQSIYGFRQANPQGMRVLWESEDWANVRFRECHRLPAHLLRAAHALIARRGYLGAEVQVPQDDGRRLLTLQCTSSPLQIRAVAQRIEEIRRTRVRSDESALMYGDFMVLCPITAQVEQVLTAFSRDHQIPVREARPGSIPEDVWKLLLVLRMLAHSDPLALRQWLQVIGLAPARIRRIRRDAIGARRSLFERCREASDDAIVSLFVGLDRLSESLVDPPAFTEALAAFPSLPLTDAVKATIGEIAQYVPSVPRMVGRICEKFGVLEAPEESREVPDADAVLVTTMHSAKGLEAEFVFIMWCNDRFMPMEGRDRDEEERVLYVGLTRARQDVILTFHEIFDSRAKRRLRLKAMSPFLRAIGDHLEIRGVTAADLK